MRKSRYHLQTHHHNTKLDPLTIFLTDDGIVFLRDEDADWSDSDSTKKSLSVESPAFTPAAPVPSTRTTAISSQAANAAPFTPRGVASG